MRLWAHREKGFPVPATTPQMLHSLFAAAFNNGDLDALVALYEPGAALATQEGVTQTGAKQLRTSFQALIGMKGKMAMDTVYVIEADGIALLRGSWNLESSASDGAPVAMQGRSIEVARKQQDGSWLFVIDHPFGAM
jgi:ketosteroid isomerase-like protein